MTHTVYLGMGTIGLIFLAISIAHFGSLLSQNPEVFQDIKNFSENIELIKKLKVHGKSMELLKKIFNIQQKAGSHKVEFSREGYLANPDGTPATDTNIITEILELKDPKEINADKLKAFETILYQIPITYLRNIPESKYDSPYILSVTPEGITYLSTKE